MSYYICEDCNKNFDFFLWVDNKIWKAIGCKDNSLLCAHCIIERMRKVKITYGILFNREYHKEHKQQTSRIDYAHLKIVSKRDHSFYRNRKKNFPL